MKAINTFPNLNAHQEQTFQQKNFNSIEAFIISRVGQLKQLGWTTQTIAESLGVNEEFIERASYLYAQSI